MGLLEASVLGASGALHLDLFDPPEGPKKEQKSHCEEARRADAEIYP
jgi:hypothetical protein